MPCWLKCLSIHSSPVIQSLTGPPSIYPSPSLGNLLSFLCYGSRCFLQAPMDCHIFFLHLGMPSSPLSKPPRRLWSAGTGALPIHASPRSHSSSGSEPSIPCTPQLVPSSRATESPEFQASRRCCQVARGLCGPGQAIPSPARPPLECPFKCQFT